MMRVTAVRLAVIAAFCSLPALPQKVVEFPHSGIHHPLRLSANDIVVRVARSTEATERAIIAAALPQSVTIQRMDQDYLVRLPGTPDLRNITALNSPARQPGIIDLLPVLQQVIDSSSRGNTPRPPTEPRMQTFQPLVVLTKEVLLQVPSAAEASAIASATGALSSRQSNAATWWILAYAEPLQALDAAEWVVANRRVPVTPMFGQFLFPRRPLVERTPREGGVR